MLRGFGVCRPSFSLLLNVPNEIAWEVSRMGVGFFESNAVTHTRPGIDGIDTWCACVFFLVVGGLYSCRVGPRDYIVYVPMHNKKTILNPTRRTHPVRQLIPEPADEETETRAQRIDPKCDPALDRIADHEWGKPGSRQPFSEGCAWADCVLGYRVHLALAGRLWSAYGRSDFLGAEG